MSLTCTPSRPRWCLGGPAGHVLLPPLEPTYYSVATSRCSSGSSRIDLILASHSALPLVTSVDVLAHIRDGGHSPVVATLQLSQPLSLCWQCPRPRPPAMLLQPSAALRGSAEWADLMERWTPTAPAHAAMDPSATHDATSLSAALIAALHHLVEMAGGWVTRPLQRRSAYDSNDIRAARRRLLLLQKLDIAIRPLLGPGVGAWPRDVVNLLETLACHGVVLGAMSATALCTAIAEASTRERAVVQRLLAGMRQERHKRWKDTLSTAWRDRPGVIYRWLEATGMPWGTSPILRDDGEQCCTVAEVDLAVRGFWVDQVLRQHATLDETAAWDTFLASRFGQYIPSASWPRARWDGARVYRVLRGMREAAAPGYLGIPVAVWKSLPMTWYDAVARLFTLVEEEGRWPTEWLDAYIAMIPKAVGGTRPRDQRPITVLEVLYRVWSKGIILEWGSVLQRELLGPWAMGFRAGSGTLHLAQLLADLIQLQRRRGAELWLASFDIEKAFDSLPWWAVFRTLLKAGIAPEIVRSFAAFYRALRRRFRYGSVDGSVWGATNGLAQGCPASPDLLNILFEAFHRWAADAGLGVPVMDGLHIASASFADDVALIATSRAQLEQLIAAYLDWCQLLGVRVTKVQLWCSVGAGEAVAFGGGQALTQATFKIVGVQLGADAQHTATCHFERRLPPALAVSERLRALAVPASLAALLWRTTVIPRALYGCEFHNVPVHVLRGLRRSGLAVLQCKPPLALSCWRAPEIVTGLPFGDTALRDPEEEARWRQVRWAHLVANLPGLVGTVNRIVASGSGGSLLHSPVVAAALAALGWSLSQNPTCWRAQTWPQVSLEDSYPGAIVLLPDDSTFPDVDAIYTDGSLTGTLGGAAAVSMECDPELAFSLHVGAPRSSTHCELVALILALRQRPPLVLTDSLAALSMLRGWGTWPLARVLACPDRVEIREAIFTASLAAVPTCLEKVKAHDEVALAAGWPKAVGNHLADRWAKQAAQDAGGAQWLGNAGRFGDPVELKDASGSVILDVCTAFQSGWWLRSQRALVGRRAFMALLYPLGLEFDWSASNGIFRRPTVSGGAFVHIVTPAVIKWTARVRAGCLASGERLHRHGMQRSSPACMFCPALVEDDHHLLSGCTGTGTADWAAGLQEVWQSVASALALSVAPPATWLAAHHLPLLAALIPQSLHALLPAAVAPSFAHRLHAALATHVANLLWRREALRIQAAPATALATPIRRPCPLPPERQLSPATLRRLEAARRQVPMDQPSPASPQPGPALTAPAAGDPRRRWLRLRLVALLESDTVVCAPNLGATAVELTELFERVAGEPFSDTPGVPLTSRIRGLAKVMGNLTRCGEGVPPLTAGRRRDLRTWSRIPQHHVDVEAWRRRIELTEQSSLRPQRRRLQMAEADAGLALWVRNHPYLQPAELAVGEPGVALLLLWEVDHCCPWPSQAEDQDLTGTLTGFTRRLKRRVAADTVLAAWLHFEDVQRPLAFGLADTHHTRWSLRVRPPPPSDPQGWWLQFTEAWRSYLTTQQHHLPAPPAPPVDTSTDTLLPEAPNTVSAGPTPAPPARRSRSTALSTTRPRAPRPANRRRVPAVPAVPTAAPAATPAPAPAASRHARPATSQDGPPRKRQATMTAWLRPSLPPTLDETSTSSSALRPRTEGARHGRATEGPPT